MDAQACFSLRFANHICDKDQSVIYYLINDCMPALKDSFVTPNARIQDGRE